MDKVEPENPVEGFKELLDSKDKRIEELEIRIASLEEVIEGLVNLQPLPELTETKAV